MKLTTVMTGALAALTLAGCGTHAGQEIAKANEETQLRSQKWASNCDTSNLLWAAAGVKSMNAVYDFQNGDAGKTIQFFSEANCDQSKVIAQATYSGTQDIGVAAAGGTARVLDLNYTKVVVTVSSADLVSALNSILVPSCGFNDWATGQGKDLTAQAGNANCLIVPKPAQSFDIVKTDGQTTFFGDKATGDATTQEKRPTALDTVNGYHKL